MNGWMRMKRRWCDWIYSLKTHSQRHFFIINQPRFCLGLKSGFLGNRATINHLSHGKTTLITNYNLIDVINLLIYSKYSRCYIQLNVKKAPKNIEINKTQNHYGYLHWKFIVIILWWCVKNSYFQIKENLHNSDTFALLPAIYLSVGPLTYIDLPSSDLLHLWIKSNCFCLKSSRFCSFSPDVRAKKATPLPWSPYQMILRINDTSLQPGFGPSYVSIFLCELVLNTKLVLVPKCHAVRWTWTLSFAFRPPFSRVRWRLYTLKNKINVSRSWIGLCGEQVLLCLSGI